MDSTEQRRVLEAVYHLAAEHPGMDFPSVLWGAATALQVLDAPSAPQGAADQREIERLRSEVRRLAEEGQREHANDCDACETWEACTCAARYSALAALCDLSAPQETARDTAPGYLDRLAAQAEAQEERYNADGFCLDIEYGWSDDGQPVTHPVGALWHARYHKRRDHHLVTPTAPVDTIRSVIAYNRHENGAIHMSCGCVTRPGTIEYEVECDEHRAP